MDGTGFKIKPLQIDWTTKAFNRLLIRFGNKHPWFWEVWFTLGLYVSLVLLPISTYYLFTSFFQNFSSSVSSNVITIEPIVPGINLPLSELGYYSFSLVLCSIVHEAGHALAAVRENVNLECVGINIIFILPIAYVILGTEKLFSLKNNKILKILCAGVWHNIVLSLVAYSLYLLLPYLFSFVYHVNQGVTVTQVSKFSPLLGPRGLKVGDAITKINDCEVYNEESWVNCIKSIHTRKSGFCVHTDIVHDLDESIPLKHLDNGYLDCCKPDKQNFCFENVDSVSSDGILKMPSHVCLPARTIVEKTVHFCSFEPHECPDDLFCFRPLIENYTNLFKIVKSDNSNVIYSGPVLDVYRTVDISPFIINLIFKTTFIADVTMKVLKYITIFSLGLAIINVIPCWFMDGQYIINILGSIGLLNTLGKKKTQLSVFLITTLFTFVLIFHCLFNLWKMLAS